LTVRSGHGVKGGPEPIGHDGRDSLVGSRWLCQRSLHCLPERLPRSFAIWTHFSAPCFSTSSARYASSSDDQGPFTLLGLKRSFQRSRHCEAEREPSGKAMPAISSQGCCPFRECIIVRRRSSSAADQGASWEGTNDWPGEGAWPMAERRGGMSESGIRGRRIRDVGGQIAVQVHAHEGSGTWCGSGSKRSKATLDRGSYDTAARLVQKRIQTGSES
jgi:hypothetical protein